MSYGRGSQSGQTAGTLILIGLILQAIEVVVLLGVGFFLLFFPFIGGIVLALAFIGIIWVVLIYLFSYQRTTEGDYEGARTPTLVFAILSLVTFGLISGILYLIAYVKLGDAASESRTPSPMGWPTPPVPPAAAGQRFCPYCGSPSAVQSAFCAKCGARFQ
jgi:hypothetical protein